MRENHMKMEFDAISENEAFARYAVSAFASQLNPILEEIADIRCAVSEAVTNSIIHAYDGKGGKVHISCDLTDNVLTVTVCDSGSGIEDIKQAMQPLYTTSTDDERSGMGFTVMETFMDTVDVSSQKGVGTTVTMTKKIGV